MDKSPCELITVRAPRGTVHHWQTKRATGRVSNYPSRCGQYASWVEGTAELATCPTCINTLSRADLKRLYPQTYAERFPSAVEG